MINCIYIVHVKMHRSVFYYFLFFLVSNFYNLHSPWPRLSVNKRLRLPPPSETEYLYLAIPTRFFQHLTVSVILIFPSFFVSASSVNMPPYIDWVIVLAWGYMPKHFVQVSCLLRSLQKPVPEKVPNLQLYLYSV